MKKILPFIISVSTVALILIFYSCSNNNEKKPGNSAATGKSRQEDVVKLGQHLVTIIGCNDCHSPKKMGAQGPEIIADLMLSGYPSSRPLVKPDSKLIKEGFPMFYPDLTAAAGPWGISFAGNLTPDDTGIGNWTEEQFKKALTEGKFKGLDDARTLLPPMPWMNFRALTDEEIHAIFSYLKSIKPVKNIVPGSIAPDKV